MSRLPADSDGPRTDALVVLYALAARVWFSLFIPTAVLEFGIAPAVAVVSPSAARALLSSKRRGSLRVRLKFVALLSDRSSSLEASLGRVESLVAAPSKIGEPVTRE